MKIFSNICFCGSGAWGQAIAITLARSGYSSTMIVNDEFRLKVLNEKYPDLEFATGSALIEQVNVRRSISELIKEVTFL